MSALLGDVRTPIESFAVHAFRIPTDQPEADGTLDWNATTLVALEVDAGNERGLGFTYADSATAELLRSLLGPQLIGRPVHLQPAIMADALHAVRNLGREGIGAMALSAIDIALWDLRAKLVQQPLSALLGMARESVMVYGSGGFTSYSDAELHHQLAGWAQSGMHAVKMKIGNGITRDCERIAVARAAIGPEVELFVDANGAYYSKQALALAERMTSWQVSWFEEPVYHRDFDGLHTVQSRAPTGMDISAGEYGYDPQWFRDLLAHKAVDVLQADATRCGGISGFLAADALCSAWYMPLSAHCAPNIHVHAACASQQIRHIEYFHDHARIEQMFFDGAITPRDGRMAPDLSRFGHGLELKHADLRRFAL